MILARDNKNWLKCYFYKGKISCFKHHPSLAHLKIPGFTFLLSENRAGSTQRRPGVLPAGPWVMNQLTGARGAASPPAPRLRVSKAERAGHSGEERTSQEKDGGLAGPQGVTERRWGMGRGSRAQWSAPHGRKITYSAMLSLTCFWELLWNWS